MKKPLMQNFFFHCGRQVEAFIAGWSHGAPTLSCDDFDIEWKHYFEPKLSEEEFNLKTKEFRAQLGMKKQNMVAFLDELRSDVFNVQPNVETWEEYQERTKK